MRCSATCLPAGMHPYFTIKVVAEYGRAKCNERTAYTMLGDVEKNITEFFKNHFLLSNCNFLAIDY